MIHDPFSEDSFWFDEPDWTPDSLNSEDDFGLSPTTDQWGWDEWGELCVFRPQGYEPCYRYPLLVWLSVDESPDQTLRDWFPDVSDRNYLAVGIPLRREANLVQNAELVATSIREVSALYGIHSDRIWIAGTGAAAEWASWLLPHLSSVVAGLVAIAPWLDDPLDQPALQAATGKQLFLVTAEDDSAELAKSFAEYWEMCAGDFTMITVNSLEKSRIEICRELNLWLMKQVCSISRS